MIDDDKDTHHFLTDCSSAISDNSPCDIHSVTLGYHGGSATCNTAGGYYDIDEAKGSTKYSYRIKVTDVRASSTRIVQIRDHIQI